MTVSRASVQTSDASVVTRTGRGEKVTQMNRLARSYGPRGRVSSPTLACCCYYCTPASYMYLITRPGQSAFEEYISPTLILGRSHPSPRLMPIFSPQSFARLWCPTRYAYVHCHQVRTYLRANYSLYMHMSCVRANYQKFGNAGAGGLTCVHVHAQPTYAQWARTLR